MKTASFILLVFGSQLLAVPLAERNTDEYRRKLDQEREQQIQEVARECSSLIEKAAGTPADQAIPVYGNVLIRLGGWQRADTLVVYQRAQSQLLSTSGHATYYRDKVNELREQVKAGNLSIDDWSSDKGQYFRVLAHMPSEEAVEVLGGFAADKFGFVFSEDPKDLDVPGLKEYDYSHLDHEIDFSVCLPAIKALEVLIEDPPARVGQREVDRQAVWAQWWKEVKSGQRKYRFNGSSVEHPVNPPPGTFREQRRPEREPGFSPNTTPAGKPAYPPSVHSKDSDPQGIPWKFIAGIAAFLLAMAFFLLKIVKRK